MQKYVIFFVLFFLTGCASVEVSHYIQDDNPYRQTFNASYDETLDAVEQALLKDRWNVVKTADPALYEHSRDLEAEDAEQIMLITDVHQISFILWTRYARLNVYLLGKGEGETEVEIRYLRANSIGFKTFYNTRHDTTVQRLFDAVDAVLNPQEVEDVATQNF